MPLLEVSELRKSYGDREVLRGVSLSLDAGECHGLLGPNGAGKTTTLRLCLGLTDPDFTVFENLLVYGRYFGEAEATIRGRIPNLLEFAGLTARATSKIQTLSGGMKRRQLLS
jgi:lipooligosaccharide transport system ATP-binding protein